MSLTSKNDCSPVDFQLRAAGVSSEGSHNPQRSGKHNRGFLPHVKLENASYFVTFRLEGTLPKSVLFELLQKRAEHVRIVKAEANQSAIKLRAIQRQYFKSLESILDTPAGTLADPRLARLVSDALRFFHDQRYRLDAWVVMPTHVHVVLWPMPGHTLSEILQSWKRFTAREANKVLNKTNHRFWQPESYDHWIRNPDEHARCCRYTIQNPVKARLCSKPEDWPWSSAHCNADL